MSGKAVSKTEGSIGVLYKFRLTADERSAAIDHEEIASVVAGRNDAADAKETRIFVAFLSVTRGGKKKSRNATAVGCAQ